LIHKVNRPAYLSLVTASKASENDPGSSQGSGLFYDGPPQSESPPQKSPESEEKPESEKPVSLSVVASVEQVGMTEVVKDFYEHKHDQPTVNRLGLTTKYAADSSPAKGLLLNKKAE
jgi:hypothetical protein